MPEIETDWLNMRTLVLTGTSVTGQEMQLVVTWDAPDDALDNAERAKERFAHMLEHPAPGSYTARTSRRGKLSWTIVRHGFAWPGVKISRGRFAFTLFVVTMVFRRRTS